MGKLRELRKTVLDALTSDDWPRSLDNLDQLPPKDLVGPLFACLLEHDAVVRWRAVTAFGRAVVRLYAAKPEDARQLMRQLMWRLNEESGNVAWGIPEVFGEVLANQPALAAEFHKVLASYINERDCATGDNYLELCPLRRGVYWGLGRLAHARPDLALVAFDDLALALTGDDPESRGLAAWALAPLLDAAGTRARPVRAIMDVMRRDGSRVELYRDNRLERVSVGDLAAAALGD